jgi:hypothetical protein
MREVLEASYALAAFVNETQAPVSTFETWVLESPPSTSQASCEALWAGEGGGGHALGGLEESVGAGARKKKCKEKKSRLLPYYLIRVKGLLYSRLLTCLRGTD